MDHVVHGYDAPTTPRCKMYMLWNADIIDTCVVFRWWHIRTYTGFVLSLLVIVALGILFEYLRVVQRKLDKHIAQSLTAKGKVVPRGRDRSNSPNRGNNAGQASPNLREGDYEELGLLTGRLAKIQDNGLLVPPVFRFLRALIYGVIVFLSFFLMLVFMTYNAYYIFAVVIGAAVGHYIFGGTMNTNAILHGQAPDKDVACH